jgi:RNA polymerase sigma-70 factor (ECF subfamily)
MTDSGQRGEEATDAELIAAWRAGDQRAAARLVERHTDALARFAAAGSDWEGTDIEELVQDTFVRAFGSIDGFRGESSLRTWLISIERRLMLDRRRGERRRQREQPVSENAAVTEYDPLDHLLAREAAARMRLALAALSPTQRHVFILRVNEGLSYREIARVVDTTEGAARVHYHNALRAVKEILHD